MPTLASKIDCTGCGACYESCVMHCITMVEDSLGSIYPKIDNDKCIECKACEKKCPILNVPDLHYPIRSYACWNNDQDERRTSASGGIASAFYKVAISLGYKAIGASQNNDFSVSMKLASTSEELKPFKNSKYVFCSIYDVFFHIKKNLDEDQKIIVIGLPCHIAAFRKLFPKTKDLILVDLVCHGSIPTGFLQQHLANIQKKFAKKAVRMSFRAPEKGTASYYFTLYDANDVAFYSKCSNDGELYNKAFHGSIAYRENCYNCRFARSERVGDITLGDYHGLGEMAPCTYTQDQVSVMFINTPVGKEFLDIMQPYLYLEERPVEEAINGDAQLRRPSPKHKMRMDFEKAIIKNDGDFDKTMIEVLRKEKIRTDIEMVKRSIKHTIKKIIS